jgi:hypothetical protein
MLLHWRVQCQVLDLLSDPDWQRYVGLLGNKMVDSCRLAEYPKQGPPYSASLPRSDGNLRGRRNCTVMWDSRYALGCPIPGEPLWDLQLKDDPPQLQRRLLLFSESQRCRVGKALSPAPGQALLGMLPRRDRPGSAG